MRIDNNLIELTLVLVTLMRIPINKRIWRNAEHKLSTKDML